MPSLTTLPMEIQRNILSRLVVINNPLRRPEYAFTCHLMNIARVCSVLRAVALSIFFSDNTFSFDDIFEVDCFLQFLRSVGMLDQLRTLEFPVPFDLRMWTPDWHWTQGVLANLQDIADQHRGQPGAHIADVVLEIPRFCKSSHVTNPTTGC